MVGAARSAVHAPEPDALPAPARGVV